MSRPNAFVFLLLALVASAATSSALAHEVRPAYLQLTETAKDSWAILWKQPILQDMQLPIAPDFGPDCELLADGLSENTGSALLTRWTTNCALDKATITINGLTATLTDVMVRLDHANGDTSSFLLRPDNPSVDLSEQGLPLLGYLRLGIEHLLFGIDHVLFVVGLVLFIPGRLDLLKTITAFTLAHSLTLALSVLELVKVPQAPVEAIIALSILFLARELVVPVERRSMLTRARPWIMAFLFGLLHGLGFAGVLAEIGLPSGQFAASLLLFNVGIEIGQLLVILPMLILITVVHRLTASERAFTTYAWVMGSVAGMWTLDRIIGVFS
ncbi:MAG: HupE/UreJ family protein [Pseudomonadales bacterium]|nr:HupE/UreJ family protein [Pseudomonadales bacterium]MCP5185934.1 HupE/UreJ family protein [Pseudomonadales bacterium]